MIAIDYIMCLIKIIITCHIYSDCVIESLEERPIEFKGIHPVKKLDCGKSRFQKGQIIQESQ